jgi:hypothetical protein
LAGPFQQLVMLALVRLGRDTPASLIRRHIQATTGRRISITAVHTTLWRLATRGYTASWTRPIMRLRRFGPGWWKQWPVSVMPLGARRFHTLQTPGRRALRLTLAAEDVLRPGLPGLGREEVLHPQHGPAPPRARSWWAGLPLNRRLRRLLDAHWFGPLPEWLRLKLPRALRPPPSAPSTPAQPAAPGPCAAGSAGARGPGSPSRP